MAHTVVTQTQVTIGNTTVTARKETTDESVLQIQQSVSDSVTDLQVACDLDVSQAKVIYINCDQDVTVETNDGTTPDETFALKANEPYLWTSGSAFTNKFATDLTDLFITNASGTAATLDFVALSDPTV